YAGVLRAEDSAEVPPQHPSPTGDQNSHGTQCLLYHTRAPATHACSCAAALQPAAQHQRIGGEEAAHGGIVVALLHVLQPQPGPPRTMRLERILEPPRDLPAL